MKRTKCSRQHRPPCWWFGNFLQKCWISAQVQSMPSTLLCERDGLRAEPEREAVKQIFIRFIYWAEILCVCVCVCVWDGGSTSLTVGLCVIFWWVWQIGAPGSVIEEPGPTRLNYSWAALWHGVDCHNSEDTKSHFLIALLSLTVLFIYNSAFIISNVFL